MTPLLSKRPAALSTSCLMLALLSAGCSTRIATRHVAPSSDAVLRDEGIHYYLPRTLVRVSIPVSETTTKAGPYADLAPHFFPFVDPKRILTNSTAYSIDPTAVTFASRGVRDPDHHYVVKPTGDWWANTVFKFSLASDGVVNKLDISVENRSVDLTLTAIEAAAGIASKVATGGAAAALALPKTPVDVATVNRTLAKCPFYDGARGDMSAKQQEKFATLVARYRDAYCYMFPEDRDAVFNGKSWDVFLRYLRTEILDLPSDELALRKEAASTKIRKYLSGRSLVEELDTIQSNNAGLLNQLAPNSSVEVWRAIQEARLARTKEILAQFFGTRSSDPAHAVAIFDIDPETAKPSKTTDLFDLSATDGICAVAAGSTPVSSLPIVACSTAPQKIAVDIQAIGPVVAAVAAAPSGESGIRYRIPGHGQLTLTSSKGATREELGRAFLDIAQYGSVASLPKRTGGLKTQYTVELDPASGALRDITVGNEGILTSDAISRAGKIAESAIDTKRALNPPSPTAPSAQELAERERKLKEERLRIVLLDECLSDPGKAGCAELIKPE
jgi:hypothetical protein